MRPKRAIGAPLDIATKNTLKRGQRDVCKKVFKYIIFKHAIFPFWKIQDQFEHRAINHPHFSILECKDKRSECSRWKDGGFCRTMVVRMRYWCPKTCDLCQGNISKHPVSIARWISTCSLKIKIATG